MSGSRRTLRGRHAGTVTKDQREAIRVRLAHYVAERVPKCTATFYPGEGHTDPLTRHLPEILGRLARFQQFPASVAT